MATVLINGRFVPQDEARVSAFDAGVQHGVGLFETMLGGSAALGAWVFRLEEHLDRLIGSARELGLSDELRAPGLAEAVLKTVGESGLARARVRLTITGGDLNLLGRRSESPGEGKPATRVQPTVMVVAQPATQYPEEMYERGAGVVIADLRVNPLDPMAGHKTVNYWARLRDLQMAAAKQAGEALVFQVTNYLAGGCVSNAFIVKGSELVTPIARGEEGEAERRGAEGGDAGAGAAAGRGGIAVPSPVLPGITRGWVMEWASAERIRVRRRMVTIDDVLEADEVFLTNSSWGVMPVVRVERERIGDGGVGEVTRRALEAWRQAVGAVERGE